ncbi:nucleoside recognition domain-containing protein [Aeribacillus composti]|uniref:nucleoside recognition domain-containing protein n=1 Tax=Aeribacillus composti TaxID=1868734 RepID=UPI003D1F5735
MIHIIWVALTLIGVIFAMFNGTMEEVNKAVFSGAKEGVTIAFGFISVLVFWLGLMNIAEKSGLLEKLGNLFKPLMRRIFPDVPPEHPAMGYMLSNLLANMFGLGNAATPLGIKAMEQLKKLNKNKDQASRSMITFLALNTTGLTLVPTTVISIRMTYGSHNPTDIVVPTLLSTFFATIAAIMIDRYFYYLRKRKGE